MKNNMRKWFLTKSGRNSVSNQKARKSRKCLVEMLESRALLTASSVASGIGTDIESTGNYGTYATVGSDSNAGNPYSSWSVVDVPVANFGLSAGVTGVSSLALSLYLGSNSTSGTYAPVVGSFNVYFIPNDTVNINSVSGSPYMEFQGTVDGTETDLGALGTNTAGGYENLGIPSSSDGVSSTDLVGTFTNSASPGSTTYNFSSLGAGAQAGIEADINNGDDVRLAIVSNTSGPGSGYERWEGNYAAMPTEDPTVQLNVTEAPLANFSASNYTVTESDQVPTDTTTDTITVDRTSNPSTTTVINYATSDGTDTAPTDYTATSGSLTFAPGVTSMTFPVIFNNITTTNATGTVDLTLTQPGSNSPQAIFPTGGDTATATINYLQANNVTFDSSSYSVNEAAGTASIVVDRSGTNLTSPSTVNYATADGVPYATSLTDPDDAEAGRDYTATSGTLSFAANQTSAIITVPLLDVSTFAGTRSFTMSLSSPGTGTELGSTTQTGITITDNAVAGADTTSGYTTYSAGIQTNGPYDVNSYDSLVSSPVGSQGYADMPEMEFGPGSAVNPTSYAVSAVDSVELSIYNTAISGGYGGIPGSFDVYALLDDTTTAPTSGLTYEGGTGNTGASVIGSQAGAVYIGSAQFPNNQIGYNNFVFDNIPTSVSTQLASDLTTPSTANPIRFVIVPSSGSPVTTDWEGNASEDAPQLTLLVQPSPAVVENFNVASTSTTVDKTAGTATITVNRTSSTGDLSDTATVQYTTSDGTTGIVGMPYNGAPGVAGTDYTAESGTLSFAAGQSSATITVPILNNTSIYGDKSLTVTISDPVTGDDTRISNAPSATDVVTIDDARTVDVYQNASDLASIQTTGPSATTSYLDVEPAGTYQEFGVADFNNPYVLPYSVPSTVGTINQISLSTVAGFPAGSWETDGALNVYLVSDTTTSIDAGTGSPLIFDSAEDPVGGLGTQLGITYQLGTINFSNAQSTDAFTSFPLTNANSTALGILTSDLNNGDTFRIAVTPSNSTVAASFEGFYSNTETGLFEAPIIDINYTPAGAAPAAPTVNASGSTGQTFTLGGSAVAVDSDVTVSSTDADITGASETITNYQSGDSLNFTNTAQITGSYTGGVLTLTGSATPAQYQAALQSVTFSTTSTDAGGRTIDVVADDSAASTTTSNTAVDSVVVHINAPVVTASGSTGQTFTLGGSAVTVDSGITATSADASLTGATETITNAQTGDTLIFNTQNGITGSYTGGVLTLTGSSSPANYQTALQSVTFSTTSTTKGTRTIDVVASDSNANTTTSNTAIDSVVVAINAPVVTANQTSKNSTAGQTVTVDSAVTVTSADADVTGATVTIGTGYQSGNDTLHFTNQNGITGSYASGVLTLTGSSTPAFYQTALQSVTYSSTSTSTATRNISIVVTDSNATTTTSNTATTQILVSAPLTITGAYVAGSAWTTTTFVTTSERFDSYLISHSLGDATFPAAGY
ncbi:MAG TPA: Calx-beta domain-containing protein, partial [Pirellulales bacterium]|nr:Calx-beta domain-containing protein [Pirellulales bacterium]